VRMPTFMGSLLLAVSHQPSAISLNQGTHERRPYGL